MDVNLTSWAVAVLNYYFLMPVHYIDYHLMPVRYTSYHLIPVHLPLLSWLNISCRSCYWYPSNGIMAITYLNNLCHCHKHVLLSLFLDVTLYVITSPLYAIMSHSSIPTYFIIDNLMTLYTCIHTHRRKDTHNMYRQGGTKWHSGIINNYKYTKMTKPTQRYNKH